MRNTRVTVAPPAPLRRNQRKGECANCGTRLSSKKKNIDAFTGSSLGLRMGKMGIPVICKDTPPVAPEEMIRWVPSLDVSKALERQDYKAVGHALGLHARKGEQGKFTVAELKTIVSNAANKVSWAEMTDDVSDDQSANSQNVARSCMGTGSDKKMGPNGCDAFGDDWCTVDRSNGELLSSSAEGSHSVHEKHASRCRSGDWKSEGLKLPSYFEVPFESWQSPTWSAWRSTTCGQHQSFVHQALPTAIVKAGLEARRQGEIDCSTQLNSMHLVEKAIVKSSLKSKEQGEIECSIIDAPIGIPSIGNRALPFALQQAFVDHRKEQAPGCLHKPSNDEKYHYDIKSNDEKHQYDIAAKEWGPSKQIWGSKLTLSQFANEVGRKISPPEIVAGIIAFSGSASEQRICIVEKRDGSLDFPSACVGDGGSALTEAALSAWKNDVGIQPRFRHSLDIELSLRGKSDSLLFIVEWIGDCKLLTKTWEAPSSGSDSISHWHWMTCDTALSHPRLSLHDRDLLRIAQIRLRERNSSQSNHNDL